MAYPIRQQNQIAPRVDSSIIQTINKIPVIDCSKVKAISQRNQVILIIDKKETRSRLALLAQYQQHRFFGYHIRCFKVAPRENAMLCILNNIRQEELPINSRILICNGVLQTTEQLASDFFLNLQNREIGKKRKSSSAESPPAKKQAIPRLGLTTSGKVIANYVRCALETGRWDKYFNQLVLNFKIHNDYQLWCHEINKGQEFKQPVDIRPFIKVLNGLLPMLRSNVKNYSQFPTAAKCKELWTATQKAIQAERMPAHASVERYILSSDRVAFENRMRFAELYDDYQAWCTTNGYGNRKKCLKFISCLSSLVLCRVSWEKECVTFIAPKNIEKTCCVDSAANFS